MECCVPRVDLVAASQRDERLGRQLFAAVQGDLEHQLEFMVAGVVEDIRSLARGGRFANPQLLHPHLPGTRGRRGEGRTP